MDATDREAELMRMVKPYTMTPPVRMLALLRAVDYLDRAAIAGEVVECGVWRGGNMLMIKAAREGHPIKRDLYLYDTFAGMAGATERDTSRRGLSGLEQQKSRQRNGYVEWAYASLEEVKDNFVRVGLGTEGVHFIQGLVEDTLKDEHNLPKEIALLRLDTDFYESTKAELEILYPRLSKGGVLIIDDYGYWSGSKEATDEFFANIPVYIHRIDRSARLIIKP